MEKIIFNIDGSIDYWNSNIRKSDEPKKTRLTFGREIMENDNDNYVEKTMSNWQKGIWSPKPLPNTIIKACRILNVNAMFFLGQSDYPHQINLTS